jgi:RAP1 GTPase activating protein 1
VLQDIESNAFGEIQCTLFIPCIRSGIEQVNLACSYRILVRAISYTVHGLIPASCVFADRYNREEVVRSLGKEINLNPPLTLGQLPDTPDELLKLDQVSGSA